MLLPRVVKGVSSEEMLDRGVDRRDFLKICSIAAAAVGLPAGACVKMAEAALAGQSPQ